jgi:shikimate kinase
MNTTAGSPIALIGLMGAGKSEVARRIAGRLGLPMRDLDAEFERQAGRTIAQWFAERGEASFRERERELLERAVAEGPAVIACGGGAVLDEAARAALAARCRTVWLEVSPAEAARRLSGSAATRPLLTGGGASGEAGSREAQLERLLIARAPLYRAAARWRITTDALTPEQVTEAVLAALESGGPS